ncbi:MAG TPA: extracellular solute-binding protein [Verrucomicrobiae bacterium]|nr:extracellular solute-binding protein [Verrucomicrobiae bacterium]
MGRTRPAWRGFATLGSIAVLAALTGGGITAAGKTQASRPVTLTVEINGVLHGKNAAEAIWLSRDVFPRFEKSMAARGHPIHITLVGSGVSGTDYANALALDIKAGGGPDIFDLDGPYYGEFASAGYLKPLDKVIGPQVSRWPGWKQIPPAVQAITQFNGQQYGIPGGTDARVLFYNTRLFHQAGIQTPWQPTSWADLIATAKTLQQKDPGIEALQIDGGAAMGEATTLQGFLPMLAGAGQLLYSQTTSKWQGNTPAMRAAANFYHTIYSSGVANAQLQLGPNGRNQTFQAFAENKVGIYSESEYLYESVIVDNGTGLYPMPNRNQDVGWAFIPAETPGAGLRGQNFVSMSGGGGTTINPNSKHPQLAWDLLTYMDSTQSLLRYEPLKQFISSNRSVNKVALASDPLLTFISQKVLPITAYRPSLAVYPQVSLLIQQLSQNLATGMSVSNALHSYVTQLKKTVGAGNVTNS